MGSYRQEHWSGLPFSSPGDLLDPGIEPESPALTGGFFTTNATWEAPVNSMGFTKFKLDLEKAKEPETKLPTSIGSSKKQESSRETPTSALLTMPMPLTVWITINCRKFWKTLEYQTTWHASWEICMEVRKKQLELDMEQHTGSKLRKEHVKAVCCHLAPLTYVQSTSW